MKVSWVLGKGKVSRLCLVCGRETGQLDRSVTKHLTVDLCGDFPGGQRHKIHADCEARRVKCDLVIWIERLCRDKHPATGHGDGRIAIPFQVPSSFMIRFFFPSTITRGLHRRALALSISVN